MKMDCEGCEFPAILSVSNEIFSRVKELIIEYYDYSGIIVKKRICRILVKVEKPQYTLDGKPVGFYM